MSVAAKPMSVNAFARRLGKSQRAITDAIDKGRITSVVTVAGKPKISDPDAAEAEFNEATRPRQKPADEASGPYQKARTDREVETAATARLRREQAELELAKLRGELVPLAEIRAEVVERYTIVRNKLLALPKMARQRIDHLTPADEKVLRDLVREALEELASKDAVA